MGEPQAAVKGSLAPRLLPTPEPKFTPPGYVAQDKSQSKPHTYFEDI